MNSKEREPDGNTEKHVSGVENKGGRRPADGSFPACPKSGICRAQSVRNHSACRNCALSEVSLGGFLAKLGTSQELFAKVKTNCKVCMDLLARTVDSYGGEQDRPDFEKVALVLYCTYGKGNVAPRYLGKVLGAPRPGDGAHARMILEELNLTCYAFNNDSDKCQYVEDLVYCKRHTPILSVNMLNRMCSRYERSQSRKRKYPSTLTISEIKQAILEHESQFKRDSNVNGKNGKHREIALRKRFNTWLRKMGNT